MAALGIPTKVASNGVTGTYVTSFSGSIYNYSSNGNLVHIVVVVQRGYDDVSLQSAATLTHSNTAIMPNTLVQRIDVPTTNRYKWDVWAFSSPYSTTSGTFTATGTSGRTGQIYASHYYFQQARSANPIRTYSTAGTQAPSSDNNGGYGTAKRTVPEYGLIGRNLIPSTDCRNYFFGAYDGIDSMSRAPVYTSLEEVSAGGGRMGNSYSPLGAAAPIPSMSSLYTLFMSLISLEIASTSVAGTAYYPASNPSPSYAYDGTKFVSMAGAKVWDGTAWQNWRGGGNKARNGAVWIDV